MKKKQINAMISLSKKAEKEQRYYKQQDGTYSYIKPMLAGAYYDKDKNKTYICNGIWGVIINGFVENLEMVKNVGTYPNLESIIGKIYKYVPTDMDYNELKQKAKEYKKDKNECLIKIGNQYFNPKIVSSVIDCFDIYRVSVKENYPMMIIESENITAVIMGVKPKKDVI